MDNSQMSQSVLLIGTALALAGLVGVIQPPGHRGGVLLALLAGTGVGIAGLALGWSSYQGSPEVGFWRLFFVSSVAGFITVVATLALAWRRARPRARPRPDAPG